MDFRAWAIEIACGFEVAHAEHAIFDGADAIDAPLIIGDGLGELALDGRLRVEAVDDFFRKRVIGGHVFRGEHDDACGEAMAKGVHAGTGAALRGLAGGRRR
jgi:hypothetical protein